MSFTKVTGDKDKFLSQDETGRLKVDSKTSSSIIIYSSTNPKNPRVASDYVIRDTLQKNFAFPHLWATDTDTSEGYNRYDFLNVFDQTISIISSLDAELEVTFAPIELTSGLSEIGTALIYQIKLGNIQPASSLSQHQGMVLTPERVDESVNIDDKRVVISVPELRQPFPAFYITVKALTIPTRGEIRILNCRRF